MTLARGGVIGASGSASGGGGGSIAFVRQGFVYAGAVASATVALTGVGAGNLLISVAFWEGADTTVSISDGTTTFTNGTAGVNSATIDGTWDVRQRPAYLLGVASGGNKTITLTLGASRNTVALHVLEFSKTAGAWALDGQAAYGQGNGTAMASGSLTTSGNPVVAVGWARNWTNQTVTAPLIGGQAALGLQSDGATSGGSWYRIGALAGGTAQATSSSSDQWLSGLIAVRA